MLVLPGLLTSPAGRAADLESTIQFAHRDRAYMVHLPGDKLPAAGLPLVVVLHGGGGSGSLAAAQTSFSAIADREQFMVAYPSGTDRHRPILNSLGLGHFATWNAGNCCGYAQEAKVDDVGFLLAMIRKISVEYPIDRRRVFVAGMSNGGMMAYRLACEASDVIAAVGVVSGAMVLPSCAPKREVSVVHLHGSADQRVPMAGGMASRALTGNAFPSAFDTVRYWAGADSCATSPQQSSLPNGVIEYSYRLCQHHTAVKLYVIEGGGHAWPGGKRLLPWLDTPSTALSATALIWRFFADHPRE